MVSFLRVNSDPHSWRKLQELEQGYPLSDLCRQEGSASVPALGGTWCHQHLPALHSFQSLLLHMCCGTLDARLRTGWHPYFTWGLAGFKVVWFWLWDGFWCCTCLCCRLCWLGQHLGVNAPHPTWGELVVFSCQH